MGEAELKKEDSDELLTSSTEERSKGCLAAFWDRFYQQKNRGWKPRPTAGASLLTFVVLFVVMTGLGGLFLWIGLIQVEVVRRYDDRSVFVNKTNEERSRMLLEQGSIVTNVKIYIDEDMKAPVYLYYKLDRYFQNHKKYIQAINYDQLHGKVVKKSGLSDCQTKKTVDLDALNDTLKASLPDEGMVNPCGLPTWSYFNDTFSNFTIAAKGAVPEAFDVNSSELVWDSDRDMLYGNYAAQNLNTIPAQRGGAELKVNVSKDEHFMTWLKFTAKPNLQKYYGKIERDLFKGETISVVINNSYNTYDFGGKKWLKLSTSGALGGRNPIFGIVWLISGVVWGVVTLAYFSISMKSGHFVRRTKEEKIAWLHSRLSWNKGKRSALHDVVSRDANPALPPNMLDSVQLGSMPRTQGPASNPADNISPRIISLPRHTLQVQAPGPRNASERSRVLYLSSSPLPAWVTTDGRPANPAASASAALGLSPPVSQTLGLASTGDTASVRLAAYPTFPSGPFDDASQQGGSMTSQTPRPLSRGIGSNPRIANGATFERTLSGRRRPFKVGQFPTHGNAPS